MNWNWSKDSVLNTYNEKTPCKEIFQAVCDELGTYYSKKGWKYSRSRPKLSFDDQNTKLEIAFWSSGSNWPGERVIIEIIPSFYSSDFNKYLKAKGIESRGYMLGYPAILAQRLEGIPKGIKRVITISGEELEFEEEYEETSILFYNHNVNIYGLNEELFFKIVHFIDTKIIPWQETLEDYEKLKKRLSSMCLSDLKEMKMGTFKEYVVYKFPEKLDDFMSI